MLDINIDVEYGNGARAGDLRCTEIMKTATEPSIPSGGD